MAVDDASLRTCIERMSSGLIPSKPLSRTIPSTTYKGSLLLLMEFTQNGMRAENKHFRIDLWTSTVLIKPITTPFQYITTHVINAQFIRLLSSYRMDYIITVHSIPCYLTEVIASTIHETFRLISTTSCIFPFGFRGKTEFFSCQTVDLLHKVVSSIVISTSSNVRTSSASIPGCQMRNGIGSAVCVRSSQGVGWSGNTEIATGSSQSFTAS